MQKNFMIFVSATEDKRSSPSSEKISTGSRSISRGRRSKARFDSRAVLFPLFNSGLAIPVDNEFGGRQFFESHRAEGMKLGGADSDLSAEAELKSIIEPGRGIDQYTGGIDFPQKSLCIFAIRSHDRLCVGGSVRRNMTHGLLDSTHHPDGKDEI